MVFTRIAPALLIAASLFAEAPQTPKHKVVDTYHGISVADDYRWLEDVKSEPVRKWIRLQNDYSRAYLDKIPARPDLRQRVEELVNGKKDVSYNAGAWAAGRFFGYRVDPALQQPQLIVFDNPNAPEKGRVLFDPNKQSTGGARRADWYKPSPNGKYLALSISAGGSESGDLHVLDVSTGEEAEAVIPGVQFPTAGGDLAWSSDSSGFYYTRYPRKGERPDADLHFYQQLWYHKLGTNSAEDRHELGRDFPKIGEIRVETNQHGDALVSVQNGDGGEFFHYIKPAGIKEWQRVTNYSDRIVQMNLTPAGDVVAISRLGAKRGKLLLVPWPEFSLQAVRVLVAESDGNIINDHYGTRTVLPMKDRLFVRYQTGGPSEIRVFDYSGKRLPGPDQLQAGAVYNLIPAGAGDVLFPTASYLTPVKMYRYEAATGKTHATALGGRADVDWSAIEAVREFATSKDGTRVPVTILRHKGLKLDGSHPMIVTGYGGYGISYVPRQIPVLKALLERGALYAVANLRGGGEFGEDWHEQGRLTRKQNVFDDFEAVLRHLIKKDYTQPDRLGITGGSNGGLLMGALITQHPELVRAAVIHVGVLDMLRSELSPNGAFNTVEFGTVKEKQHFDVLYAYSPYHRVKDGTKYPAVLLTTGLNDNRVDPMHSLKMTARLQAASTSARPVLLTVDGETGHGGGIRRSDAIDKTADEFAFLLHELGVESRATKPRSSGDR